MAITITRKRAYGLLEESGIPDTVAQALVDDAFGDVQELSTLEFARVLGSTREAIADVRGDLGFDT